MSRLPSLKALHVFHLTASLGSMARAAERLSVSQSSVSRFIGLLEDELGTPLFVRRDGLSLTPAGRALAGPLAEAFAAMERGVRQARSPGAVLRVKVPPSLGLRWLLRQTDVPRHVRFHPRWNAMTPDDDAFDVGITYGLGSWPASQAVPVLAERLLPVCTPAWLAAHGPIGSAAQLAGLPLIHADDTGDDWQRWITAWLGAPVALEPDITVDTLDAAVQLALLGRGVAMADPLLVREELARGALVPAHPRAYASGEHYHLVHRLPDRDDPRVAALLAWLRARLAADAPDQAVPA